MESPKSVSPPCVAKSPRQCQIVVQISRFPDGSRRVASIAEVRGLNADKTYNVVEIFKIQDMKRGPDGKLLGTLTATGEVPTFMSEIENNRIPGRDKFKAA